jgi:hypothetical protein
MCTASTPREGGRSAAIGQSAEAVAVEGPELGPVGEIAAVLRF